MKNKIIKRLIISFVLGALVGNLIAIISSAIGGQVAIVSPNLQDSVGLAFAILLQSVLSGIIGLAGIGGMVFYEMEKMSLLLVTVLHYASVMGAFLISFFALSWGTIIEAVIILAIMTVIFFTIWLIMYCKYKQDIKDMNEDLKKYKENMEND